MNDTTDTLPAVAEPAALVQTTQNVIDRAIAAGASVEQLVDDDQPDKDELDYEPAWVWHDVLLRI